MNTWYPLFGFITFISIVGSLGLWAVNDNNKRVLARRERERLNAERESHSRSAE
jgi:hypothetical protein